MPLLDLAMLIGAILYIATVLTQKAGPFDLFAKARMANRIGGMLSCIWCVIIYIAAIVWIAYRLLSVGYLEALDILWVFGLAGLAMIIRSYSGVNHGA